MRKKFFKVSTALIAAAMTMSMALPAFAAGTITSQDPENSSRSYSVYQIFTGEYDTAKQELKNIAWGDDANYPTGAKKGDLVSGDTLDDLTKLVGKSEREILDVVSAYANFNDTSIYGTLKAGGSLTNVPDGYYLLKDNDNAPAEGEKKDAISTYIVEVVGGTVNVKAKTATPKVDKQVLDEGKKGEYTDLSEINEADRIDVNNADSEIDGKVWSEAADHSIGEKFKFRLLAQLPEDKDIDAYKEYKLKFTDTLSEGITYDKGMVVRYSLDGGNSWETIDAKDENHPNGYVASNFVADAQTGVQTMTVTIDDLKKVLLENQSLKGVLVEVTYDAHLNAKAAISSGAGEDSDDSNKNKVKLEYSRNPEYTGGGENNPTDETPEDTVYVFTYDLDNFKVREDEKSPLANAHFKLYKEDGTTEVKLVQDTSKTQSNTTTDEEGNEVVTVTEVVYRPATEDEQKVASFVSADITSPAGGHMRFNGLEAGTYVLKEVTPPTGYTAANDMTIVISATHKETTEGAAEVVSLTRKVNNATVTQNKIVNKKGSKLPKTGGMGTTVLYTLGGMMVLGAGSVLASKKRLSK